MPPIDSAVPTCPVITYAMVVVVVVATMRQLNAFNILLVCDSLTTVSAVAEDDPHRFSLESELPIFDTRA